jgi:hypothetical protein
VCNKDELELKEADDLLHKPGKDLKWRESYYFNWVDIDNKISGFSTIGILPNEKKREFVFLLFHEDKMEVYYKEPILESYVNDVNVMLKDKVLSYKLIKPLETWHISFKSRKFTFDITFKSRFPIHSFGKDSSASWHQHFESSGIVHGEITFKNGKQVKINGYGQRDKSWGFRDWHQFDQWFAGHFQFKDWSCGFRRDHLENQELLSGYIANQIANVPISQIEITTINDNDQFKSPLTAVYRITDDKGSQYNIQAERMREKSFIRFVREFPGGYTELFEQMAIMKNLDTGEIGSGMFEHLRTIK